MFPDEFFPFRTTLNPETPDVLMQAFKGWLEHHPEPIFHNAPNREAVRKELLYFNQLAGHIFATSSNDFMGYERLEVLRAFHHWTSWKLFNFNGLPDDIILHIFRLMRTDDKEGSTMPLVFSSVCRRWRDLALDAPWLWNNIGFRDRGPEYLLTQLFVERSKAAPLKIVLDLTDKKFDFEDRSEWPKEDALLGRLSVLQPHAHRWRTLTCETDNWDPIFGLLSALGNIEAPMLRAFELRQRFPNYIGFETRKQLAVFGSKGLPALQTLSLAGMMLDWDHIIATSCNNLTELYMSDISGHDSGVFTAVQFHTLLRAATNIKKIILNGTGPQWQIPNDPSAVALQAIFLPSLEEIVVHGKQLVPDTNLDYVTFIMGFLVPFNSIKTFGIGMFPTESNFSRFIPTLQRYFTQIERLNIADMPMNTKHIGEWLNVLPNLKHISVCGLYLQGELFDTLTTSPMELDVNASSAIFCPALKYLSPYQIVDNISHVVRGRIQMGFPLQAVVMDINAMEDVRHDPLCQDLTKETGIQFEYEGEPLDPDDEWVGPYMTDDEGEMDVDMMYSDEDSQDEVLIGEEE